MSNRISYSAALKNVTQSVQGFPAHIARDVFIGLGNHFAGRKSVNRSTFTDWFNEAIDIAKGREQ